MKRSLFYDPKIHRQLTPRESVVLTAARKNKPVDTIADSLSIPKSIVIRHLSNIAVKLNDTDKHLAKHLRYVYNLDIQG